MLNTSNRSTLIAANIDNYEYEYKATDTSTLASVPTVEGPEQLQASLRKLFETLQSSNAYTQIPSGGVVAGNDSDTLLCGWGPGSTQDYINSLGTGTTAVALDSCKSTLNETLDAASEAEASKANPDIDFVPRE